ncbi:DNA methyltransferase (plasmid) [Burkholderia cenocepacia]|uniref:Methyltransferase n=2 Tax=Burkholderia cepacia complex TaxID=87882 RepID=A0A4Q2A506_9BURK|nr:MULTISPECIES: DNA methyltransferase [Burkholderia cepacia complex]KML57091.1 DNA methyltransferase [Burkholderia cepacia]KUY72692.1 DNA methylase [Burkholderia cepacia]MBK1824339.1 DNA methylase [Burkholderia orbicola]MCO8325722.1 DNA methylase [Burkholderia cenocepacia]MCO8332792.1 DNA methylase [Burkholderia cenocepacia]
MSYLYNGDCLVAMPKLAPESVDCIVTDPPYLVNFRDRSGRSIANDVNGDWLAPAFAEMFRVLKRDAVCISFYGWNKVDLFFDAWKAAGFRVCGHIVFTKNYASKAGLVRYQHESAYVLAKGRPAAPENPISDVMPFQYSGNRHHPTEKPVSALRTLISAFTQPGDVVLDPFAGSGSTCVAARELGRRYIGIELDATYYAAAKSRLSAPVAGAALAAAA